MTAFVPFTSNGQIDHPESKSLVLQLDFCFALLNFQTTKQQGIVPKYRRRSMLVQQTDFRIRIEHLGLIYSRVTGLIRRLDCQHNRKPVLNFVLGYVSFVQLLNAPCIPSGERESAANNS